MRHKQHKLHSAHLHLYRPRRREGGGYRGPRVGRLTATLFAAVKRVAFDGLRAVGQGFTEPDDDWAPVALWLGPSACGRT